MLQKRLVVRLPVGQKFQAQFDASVAKIRKAVVPVLSVKKGRPVTVGSAVLIELEGRHFFVTALHVIEDNKPEPLFAFDFDGNLVSLSGEFLTAKTFDLAAIPVEQLEGIRFAPERFLSGQNLRTKPPAGKQYATIVGYPSTKTTILKGNFIDTEMYSMADFVRKEENGRVWVKFDKRRITFPTPRRWLTAPDPYGMSGGAIFAVPVVSVMPDAASEAKLIGIATHWRLHRRLFEGTGVQTLLSFLKGIR